jgi:D-inositol-3-phosphate glycosyltransferase
MPHGQEAGMRDISRVAMISVHTSPLDQPGAGDAGGLNVYVLELARELAALDVQTDVFTRATGSGQPPVEQAADGVLVRRVAAGPFEGLSKEQLPAQSCHFVREVLRVEAAHLPNRYDAIHSHYWLSGQVGAVARDRWGVPLVHTMHTTARVKNLALAETDTAEPHSRELGEQQVVEAADRLIANTDAEADELVRLYRADPDRVDVVHPGVDLDVFRPRDSGDARARLGIDPRADVVMFVGRLQALKGPEVLVKAIGVLLGARPELRGRLVVPVIGGLSGNGLEHPQALTDLVHDLGVGDVVRLLPARSQAELAQWYAAATMVCVPSRSESFGLVALEAQACGTPVVAAGVGGLTTAVRDGYSGILVDGHDAHRWARVIGDLLASPQRLADLRVGALRHVAGFGWSRTAQKTLESYRSAADSVWRERTAQRLVLG